MSSPTNSSVFAFNGDADGIISQHLLALAHGEPARRVTGLKRDLKLLRHVDQPYTHAGLHEEHLTLYVCDINLRDNRDDLLRLLQNPTTLVTWYDHHEPGDIPSSIRLTTRISTSRGACTGLLVHADLLAQGLGQDPRWAALAAWGDNLPEAAEALLAPLHPTAESYSALREAGTLLNYNAHGENPSDVLFQPLDVATRMAAFRDPEAFIRESGFIEPLRRQMEEDEEKMVGLGGEVVTSGHGEAALYTLPGEAWARRMGSTWASRAALEHPGRAIAMLHPLDDGHYQVSIRAPRNRKDAPPASALAGEFPSGGGRALAAGINRMPAADIEVFRRRFFDTYS